MAPEEALSYYTTYEICKTFRLEEMADSINCTDFKGSASHLPQECILQGRGYGTTVTVCGDNTGAMLRHKSTSPWPDIIFVRSLVV